MNNNQMINFLTGLLVVMIIILFVLCIVFVILKVRTSKGQTNNKTEKNKNDVPNKKNVQVKSYSKKSIFEFMEFDKIEDNMIIQKDGKRFLMVISCQGINYDLMSGIEKNSVEQGFLQFLNTLRYPIQIYVQTRTVNLGSSINTYKEKIDEISRQYANKQAEYNQKVRSGQYSERELDKEKYELARERNLYEYGIDIVNNTERMSLNKNILSKHYYIIIPHYSEEATNDNFAKEEISNLAFAELYTKSQSVINSLAVCGINSKILDSTELAELLYAAYNRDESETLNLKRALNAGYDDLYSTAPDILDKRMKELDIKIEEEAIRKANEIVVESIEESHKKRKVKQKEENLEDLIDEMAINLIKDNKKTIGEEVAEKAIKKIKKEKSDRTKEEGGEEDGKETKNRARRITRSI